MGHSPPTQSRSPGSTATPTSEPTATLEPTSNPTLVPTESEPSEAPKATIKPTVSEKDSLANRSAVKSARGNLDDLSEDVSDLRRDIRNGSAGWAAWNTMEIAFNVGQLEAVEAPESISGDWNAEIKRLVSAHDDLSSAMTDDSIKQTKSALGSLEKSIRKMNRILHSW